MSNLPLLIVIFALLSILPAGVVFMVLWSRLMAHDNRISAQLGVRDDIIAVQNQHKNTVVKLGELDALIASLDDRLKNYNNRMTAYNRHEAVAAKEKEPEEKPDIDIKKLEQYNLFRNNQHNQPEQPQRLIMRKKSA